MKPKWLKYANLGSTGSEEVEFKSWKIFDEIAKKSKIAKMALEGLRRLNLMI